VATAALGLAFATGVQAAAAQAAAPTVSATLTPANPLFGDTATYVVEATVDPAVLDAARIVDGVAPFTRVAPARVTRSVMDGVGHFTVTETIACLSAPCVAGKRGAAIELPPAQVAFAGSVAAAPRVQVHVGSRVSDAAVKAADPRFSRPTGLPRPSFRFSPGAAAALLALLGLALVAVGVLVLTAPLRRTRAASRGALPGDPRERAVRLLRESVGRDSRDRRRAASLASRVVGESDLADEAAAVAWARPEPRAPDAETLADRLERTGEEARA
jgi:hypothetical protein